MSRPSPAFVRFVEKHTGRIPDAASRLRFVRNATAVYSPFPEFFERAFGFLGFHARYQLVGDPPHSLRLRRIHWRSAVALATVLLSFLVPQASLTGKAKGPSVKTWARKSFVISETPAPKVWRVEDRGTSELYSNGLRIENSFRTSHRPRNFRALSGPNLAWSGAMSQPAGIVYHTTESQMAPFDPGHNDSLKRYGMGVLGYVQERKLYHFLIDRFGRVYRVVEESDVADHAGHSVWADKRWVYINLNLSFLGVSIEAQTQPDQAAYLATPAQILAAKLLTQMLRDRYSIPAANCVTHAQVSVNPVNFSIGYHTDWATSFPFREIGLNDQYEQPLPSITLFGFDYDDYFVNSIGGRRWPGLTHAEQQLEFDAAGRNMTVADYRAWLRQRYRSRLSALTTSATNEEKTNHES